MIVHRFMSEAEYECLIAGAKLMSATDHHREKGQKTTSVGFCFFAEDPDEAIHWLRGIVSTDQCVTLDIPDHLLTESKGVYRDYENDDCDGMDFLDLMFAPAPTVERKEYCLTEYSLQTARLLSATDKYAAPRIVIESDPDVMGPDPKLSKEDIEKLKRKYGITDEAPLEEGGDDVSKTVKEKED